MIADINLGTDILGCLNYIYDPDGKNGKKVSYIGGSALGFSPEDLLDDFRKTFRLKPSLLKNVVHISISFPKPDGRREANELASIADHYLGKMGFNINKTVYTIVRHGETDHDHSHIVASRVMIDGSVWNDSHSHFRSLTACRELEIEYNLTRVSSSKADKKKLNKLDKAKMEKGDFHMGYIQASIDELLSLGIDAPEFVARLAAMGITATPNIASSGKLNGFSFRLKKVAYKGSDLGRNYSKNMLLARGLRYEPALHAAALREQARKATEIEAGDFPIPVPNQDQAEGLAPIGIPAQVAPVGTKISVQEWAPKEALRRGIDLVIRESPGSVVNLVEWLAATGIKVKAAIALNGRLSGLRFIIGNVSFKGSDLGPDYTLAGLKAKGLTYDQDTDHERLQAALAMPVAASDEKFNSKINAPWPDGFGPSTPIPARRLSWAEYSDFIKNCALSWQKDRDTNDTIYYNISDCSKRKRTGIAFIDSGDHLDVRRSTPKNILKALRLADQKWEAVSIHGSSEFIAQAELIAKAHGIPLAVDEAQALARVETTRLQAEEVTWTTALPTTVEAVTTNVAGRQKTPEDILGPSTDDYRTALRSYLKDPEAQTLIKTNLTSVIKSLDPWLLDIYQAADSVPRSELAEAFQGHETLENLAQLRGLTMTPAAKERRHLHGQIVARLNPPEEPQLTLDPMDYEPLFPEVSDQPPQLDLAECRDLLRDFRSDPEAQAIILNNLPEVINTMNPWLLYVFMAALDNEQGALANLEEASEAHMVLGELACHYGLEVSLTTKERHQFYAQVVALFHPPISDPDPPPFSPGM